MEQFPVTPKQKVFLNTITRLTKERDGIGPSYEELAEEMRCSATAVTALAKRLIARGHLQQIPRMPRTLKVVKGASAS